MLIPTLVSGITFSWIPNTEEAVTSYTIYMDGGSASHIIEDNIPKETSTYQTTDPIDGESHTYFIIANIDSVDKPRISSTPSDFVLWSPAKKNVTGILEFKITLD